MIDVHEWRSHDLAANDCPVSRTLEIVGGKWNALIIRELLGDARHFLALRRSVSPISAKVLTERLRLLEDYDIVERRFTDGRVQYQLTERGQSLRPVLAALWQWGVHDHNSWVTEAPQPYSSPITAGPRAR